MLHTFRRGFFAVLFSAAILVSADRAAAQTPTNTWTATASGNWSTAGNWDVNGVPVSVATTVVQFNNNGTTAYTATQDIAASFQLNGLIVNSTSTGAITITDATGNDLSFVANGAVNPFVAQNNTGSVTISGTTTTTGAVTFTASPTFGGGGTGGVNISAPLVFQGTGLALSGYNTTTFSNNTAGGSITLPSGGLTITGNGIGNATLSGILLGTSTSVTVNTGANNFASGAVTLSGTSTFTGGVTLQSGNLVVSNAAGLGNAANVLTITGGSLRVSATVPNPITMSGVDLLYPGTSAGTLTGPITVTGTSNLQILGTGGLTLDNTAGFNGATTVGVAGINSGTLTIGSTATTTGSLLNTTGITVNTASNSLNSGSLVLTNATAVAPRLTATTPITLNSGRVTYVSNTTGSNTASFGTVTVNGFGGIGTQNANTDTSPTALTFNGLTLANKATVGFRGLIGTGGNGTVTFTGGVTGASFTPLAPAGSPTPAILPWAVGFSGASGNTTSFNSLVTTDGTNGVRVLNPASSSDFSLVPNGASFTPGANNLYGANANVPAAIPANTTLQVNSLVFNDSTVSQDIVAGGQGSILQVFSGVIATPQAVYFTTPQIDFGSNPGYFYVAARTFTNSPITGSGGVVVSGYPFSSFVTNGLYLGAQNSFTGGLTINGGALVQFASDGALGAAGASITFGGGSLDFLGNGSYTFNRSLILTAAGGTLEPSGQNGNAVLMSLPSSLISGTGPLILSGSGTLALSGTASGTWSTVITSGILQFAAATNFGSGPITLNGGTLQPTASITFARALQVNASSTIDVGSQSLTLSNPISTLGYALGAGSPPTLTKAGVGSLTLTANNTFTGPVTVSAGTLTLSGAGALSTATAATVNAGATFTLDNTATSNNNRFIAPLTLAGGTFNLLGNTAGTAVTIGTLTASATAPGSVLSVAPTSAAAAQLTAAALNVPNGGTLVVRGTGLGGSGANTAQVFFNSAPAQVNGVIQGVFGDNDPVGGAGSFLVTYSSSAGVTPAALTPAGGTITTSTSNLEASGPTTVPAAATINSLTMDAGTTVTSTGATVTLTTGMLVSQTGAASSIDVNTTIATPAASTFPLMIATAGNNILTINGPLSSANGALVKLGTGTLTLAGSPTLTGTLTAAGGIIYVPASTTTTVGGLAGNGTVSVDGTLSLTGANSTTLFGALSGAGSVIRPVTAGAFSTQTFAGPITLTGGLETDAGTLALMSNVPAAATPIIVGGNGSAASAQVNFAPGITVSRDLDFQAGTGSRTLGDTATVANQAPITLAGTVTVESGVTLQVPQNNAVFTITGHLAGPGAVGLGSGTTTGGGTLNLTTANSSFGGTIKLFGSPTTVSLNTVLGIGSSGALGTGSLVVVGGGGSSLVGGGYLQALNGPQTLSNPITVSSSGTGGTTFGLVGTNAMTVSSVDVSASSLVIDNHSSNGSVLAINTLSGNSTGGPIPDANVTFGFPTTQVINNLYPVTPAGNVVVVGTLSNGGLTTVNGGNLQVTGSATALDGGGHAAGTITVAKYGTLSGTGTINRNTEIAGTVAPGIGSTPGTLTLTAPMVWDAGGTYAFAYSGTSNPIAGANYNTISSSSTLDMSALTTANPFTVAITRVGSPLVTSPVTYTLGSFSSGGVITGGTFNPADFAITGTPANVIAALSLDGTQSNVLLTLTNAFTWTGATSGNWSVGTNWLGGTVPTSSANTPLTFGATSNPAMTNDIAANPFVLNSMTFLSGSPVYTLGGNGLNFTTSSGGTTPTIVQNSANGVTLNTAVTLTNGLTVSGNGNLTLGGAVSGAGSLTMNGNGTLTLSGTNNYTGGTNVLSGTVSVAADANLGTGNVTGAALGTVAFTNTTTTTKSFNMNSGTISVAASKTVTFNGGTVSSAYLDGAGTFATGASGATFLGTTSLSSVTVTSNSSADQFVHFDNGGAFTVAAGTTATPVNLNGFTNEGSGSVTVNQNDVVNVANFQSYGTLTLNPGTFNGSSGNFTQLINLGSSKLFFDGGSRTFISTAAQAPNINAGIDLHGNDAVVAGGLLVNNGYVIDSTGGGHRIVADFGAVVKGAGFYQTIPQTINGGTFITGNSPGLATTGAVVIGGTGLSSYTWQINDAGPSNTYPSAPGISGPTQNAAGQVSGWGRLAGVALTFPVVTTGNMEWDATTASQFTIHMQTLLAPNDASGNPAVGGGYETSGDSTAGLMSDFDPTKSYTWKIFNYAGTYTGPTDTATLDASTIFDAAGFLNPHAGRFDWVLNQASQEMDLVFTPAAVPEPGTLSLLGLAGLGLAAAVRRRKAKKAAAAVSTETRN